MIDIHSHVVWGLDDGASSLEDSLDMLRIASEDGITDIVATPHSNAQYLFQPGLLQQRTEELARRSQGKPVIHAGCEVHVSSDNIGPLLDSPATYAINAGPYVLLEFPGLHVGRHTESFLRQLLDAGIVPIVAHPERNQPLLPPPPSACWTAASSMSSPPTRTTLSTVLLLCLRRTVWSTHDLARTLRSSCSRTIPATSSKDVLCPEGS